MPEAFQPGGRAPAPAPLDLVQDFVNTEIPDWHHDDIATPEALDTWLRERGLLDREHEVDGDVFVAARALRSALRELALANTLGTAVDPGRQRAIDAALRPFPLVVEASPDGIAVAPGGAGAIQALAAVVAAVAEARADGAWERLKACRQETCGWLFFDTSRNRSSSWCSMSICGGREKSKAYRRRRSEEAR